MNVDATTTVTPNGEVAEHPELVAAAASTALGSDQRELAQRIGELLVRSDTFTKRLAAAVQHQVDANSRPELHHVLRRARVRAGASQPDVASLVGTTWKTIGNYEAARTVPAPKVLDRLAVAFELPAPYLHELADRARATRQHANATRTEQAIRVVRRANGFGKEQL